MPGHRHVEIRQVEAVLVAAGDVPGEDPVAVVFRRLVQEDAGTTDGAGALIEVVTFEPEPHGCSPPQPSRTKPTTRLLTTLLPTSGSSSGRPHRLIPCNGAVRA